MTKKVRGLYCPWLSSEIKKLIKERDYLGKAQRSDAENDRSTYRRRRNKVTSNIRIAKAEYNSTLIEQNSDNPRNFWKAVKKVLPSKLLHLETKLDRLS